MKKLISVLIYFMGINVSAQQIAEIGRPLPPWQEGYMDLHHINTGRGNAAFYILPDGTTMLFDAGELDPTGERTFTPRNSVIRPNGSLRPYEWIVYYIKKMMPHKQTLVLDYAAISHFHDDHFGSWYPGAPLSKKGNYVLTGITGVGENFNIHHLLDRGYPNYDYPAPFAKILQPVTGDNRYAKTIENYLAFVKSQEQNGFEVDRFGAGSKTQIHLQYYPDKYKDFYVQNIKCNGRLWTGKDSSTIEIFPAIDTANRKTWPDENCLSLVLTIHYGPFTYYTGGDCAGNVFYGDAPWRDVETPVAKVVGEVDVATLDHHGNRDAVNEFQVKTLKPRVWVQQVWSADHPGHEVLVRLTTPYLYNGERDLFATNMLDANRYVIGPLIDKSYKSTQGHIVVRVLPGGKKYYVIILDDSNETLLVKDIFGPYISKETNDKNHNL